MSKAAEHHDRQWVHPVGVRVLFLKITVGGRAKSLVFTGYCGMGIWSPQT